MSSGGHCRIHAAQPTAKAAPNLCGLNGGEVLQQTLSDASELDIDMAGARVV